MIRASLVDTALNRLSDHLGPRLRIRPHAAADELAELEHIVGPLPRELTIFLATCNGLRVDAEVPDPLLHLWNTREMVSSILAAPGPGVPQGFVPISGDPTGERDWLIVGRGPAENAVVRWDPWVPGAALVASAFGTYLDGWTRYVTQWFEPTAVPARLRDDRPNFDAAFMEAYDEQVVRLASSANVQEWLQEIDHAVACGDDFE